MFGSLAVVVAGFAWARLTFPDDYLTLQAATGERLFELLRGRDGFGTTLTRDDCYAVLYGLFGTVFLLALFNGRPRRLPQWIAVVLMPVVALADITENELLRKLHRKPSAEAFGGLDDALHTVWALKWTALAVVVLAALWGTFGRGRNGGGSRREATSGSTR